MSIAATSSVGPFSAGETGPLAEQLITDTLSKQHIGRDELTIHADRGSSMTSKPVALLLADPVSRRVTTGRTPPRPTTRTPRRTSRR
jgi:hypothetical protein